MATTMETGTVTATTSGVKGPRQFQGLFDVIPFKFSLSETTSIGAEDSAVGTVTVTGAELGDFAFVTPAAAAANVQISAYVSAADTVTVYVQNLETADANTAFASAVEMNGFILKPKATNSMVWHPN